MNYITDSIFKILIFFKTLTEVLMKGFLIENLWDYDWFKPIKNLIQNNLQDMKINLMKYLIIINIGLLFFKSHSKIYI